MKISWYAKIMRGTDRTVLEDRPITEAAYEKHWTERGILDTPEYRDAVEKRRELQAQLDGNSSRFPTVRAAA